MRFSSQNLLGREHLSRSTPELLGDRLTRSQEFTPKSGGPQSKFTRSMIMRPQPSGAERTTVAERYSRFSDEVIQLRAEVMSLRMRHNELESELKARASEISQPRQTPSAPTEKTLDRWKESVALQRREIQETRNKVKQTESIIIDYQQRIAEMLTASAMARDDNQTSKLDKLKLALCASISDREQLKQEEKELYRQVYPTEAEVDDAEEIKSLKVELKETLNRKQEARRRLKLTEKRQDNEERSLQELALKLTNDRLTRIFVGLFEEKVTHAEIHTMFSKFGDIIDIAMTTFTRDDRVYYGCNIEYSDHDEAKRAVQKMHRHTFRGQPMVVLWNADGLDAAIHEPIESIEAAAKVGRSPRRKTESPVKSDSSWATITTASSLLSVGPASSFDFVQEDEYLSSDSYDLEEDTEIVVKPVLKSVKPGADRRLTNISIQMPDDFSSDDSLVK